MPWKVIEEINSTVFFLLESLQFERELVVKLYYGLLYAKEWEVTLLNPKCIHELADGSYKKISMVQ